ncbi:MAG: P-type DNA transfer ATPase VirB11 [Pseudomonadota bacterium]
MLDKTENSSTETEGAGFIATSYLDQYLQPLKALLTNEDVNEVAINPNGTVFVEYGSQHHMVATQVELTEETILQLGNTIAGETRNQLGKDHPIVSGRIMAWDSPLRVQVIIPPAIEHAVSVSIRRYWSKILKPEEIKFVTGRQVDLEHERLRRHRMLNELAREGKLESLMQQAIDQRLNIMISGGTSSGKTTMARALLAMTNQEERLVTIEDAQELHPPHRNQVALIADRRPGSERLPDKLLESSLRMRPDRLILGEIRGTEAYQFLEAINTGHPGSITTIHADSPALAFDRLALMVMRAGMQLAHSEIIQYAKKTIDLVIQVGRVNGKRGVLEIYLPSLSG